MIHSTLVDTRMYRLFGIIILFAAAAVSSFTVGYLNGPTKNTLESVADKISVRHTAKKSVQSTATSSVTILAFGDMMLDRSVRKNINEKGNDYPFKKIKSFLAGNDIVVVNAEGSFASRTSKTLNIPDAPLLFTFNPHILPTLKDLGFTLFGQANNHALNFGRSALKESEKNIEAAGMFWFGDPRNDENYTFNTEIRGQKIAFVGYNQFTPGEMATVTEAIKRAKRTGAFTIVYSHWGNEYEGGIVEEQKLAAYSFIENGADVVIGHHPHVIEPIELYKDKVIFYSLGNFVFDQSFSMKTSEGLSVGITIGTSTVSYSLSPFSIVHTQVSLMGSSTRKNVLNRIASSSPVSTEIKNEIKSGYFVTQK